LPHDALENQYFPKDITLKKGFERWINCGSYDGDTIKIYISQYPKIKQLVCVEPDINNYLKLVNYIVNNTKTIADEIIALPLGVYESEAQLRIESADTNTTALSKHGDTFMQCVALDHVLTNFKPTFINMDIEGLEAEALKGAEKLLKNNKPDLAICVYHSVNQIWEIPLYLESLNLGYKFYLRNYTGYTSETVLYATVDD
jgi:FkbM family methyltransferase